MNANLLELEGVHTHIGAYHILHGVDLAVPRGAADDAAGTQRRRQDHHAAHHHGPVAGLARPHHLQWPGHHRADTPQIAALNVAYVPENMGIFADLTVKENMLLAARQARNVGQIDDQRLKWIFSLFPAVEKFWNHPAGKLSGGQKQMLAVARAIVEPRQLLIVDEPSKGLAPAIINNMIDAFGAAQGQRRDDPARRAEHQLRQAPGRQRRRDGQRRRRACRLMRELAEDEALQQSLLGLAI